MTATEVIARLSPDHPATKTSNGWQCRCNSHPDKTASCCVSEQGGKVLIKCQAGCSTETILSTAGLTFADLFSDNTRTNGHKSAFNIVAEYSYRDKDGKELFQAVRLDPKDFRQRHKGPNGDWVYTTKGVQRVIYRLPEIIAAVAAGRTIYICEGEKDVGAVGRAGYDATCNVGGAGKWLPEYGEPLRGANVVIIADKDNAGRDHARKVADALRDIAASVKVIELPDVGAVKVKDAHDFFAAGGTKEEFEAACNADPAADRLRKILDSRRFNPDRKPKEAKAVYSIGSVEASTPGNITGIYSGIKSGKTAFVHATMASSFAVAGADTFTITSSNPHGHAVLHFDTEQSEFDHWNGIERMVRRAGAPKPDWLISCYLTGISARDSFAVIKQGLADEAKKRGAVHSAFIDGVADLVRDVNDAEECNALVAELHGLAIAYHCPIICVLHFNPGSEKSRGHLGSQLERKAETNLVLSKEGEVTSIYSERQRRAPILKGQGPKFKWSDEHQMHVTCSDDLAARDSAKITRLRMERDDAFGERKGMRYSDLRTAIKDGLMVSLPTAERRITEFHQHGLIQKGPANLLIPKD